MVRKRYYGWILWNIQLPLRLVKGNVCPRGDFLLPFGAREELTGFFFVGFPVGISLLSGFLICMDAKETVNRVFPTLAEIVLFVLAFTAPGNMGREKVGEVDLPEVRVDLSFFEEFFYVPWRILHGSYLLYQGYFISISKAGCWWPEMAVVMVRPALLIRDVGGCPRYSGFTVALCRNSKEFSGQRKDREIGMSLGEIPRTLLNNGLKLGSVLEDLLLDCVQFFDTG